MTKEHKIPAGNKCYTIKFGDNYHYREEDSVKTICPFWSTYEGGYCSRIKEEIYGQEKECGENMR